MADQAKYIEALKEQAVVLRDKLDSMRNPNQLPAIVTGVDVEIIEPAPKAEEKGKDIVLKEEEKIPPEIAQLLTQLASLSELTEIRKKLEKEEFEGKLDPRTLDATDTLQWLDLIEGLPHKPWLTAYFINDGSDSVKIGVNHPEMKHHEVKLNETLTINQEHAKERIRRLFYKCDAGESASVRVVGQY